VGCVRTDRLLQHCVIHQSAGLILQAGLVAYACMHAVDRSWVMSIG
jgi:hypothetical protein